MLPVYSNTTRSRDLCRGSLAGCAFSQPFCTGSNEVPASGRQTIFYLLKVESPTPLRLRSGALTCTKGISETFLGQRARKSLVMFKMCVERSEFSLTLERAIARLEDCRSIRCTAHDLLQAHLPLVPQEFLSPDDPRHLVRIRARESAQKVQGLQGQFQPAQPKACGGRDLHPVGFLAPKPTISDQRRFQTLPAIRQNGNQRFTLFSLIVEEQSLDFDAV